MPVHSQDERIAAEKRVREALYQGAEMLTHHALEMLKRRTGLTKVR